MITLSASVNSATVGTVRDIIFVAKDNSFGFACSLIMVDAQILYTEVIAEHEGGGNAGQGVWDITGDVLLYQNDYVSARNLKEHLSKVFDVHILFFNGDVLSSTPLIKIDGKAGKFSTATKERYMFAEDYKDLYGVVIQMSDSSGGGRALHYILSGGTVEKYDWHTKKDSDFYNLIPSVSIDGGGGGK